MRSIFFILVVAWHHVHVMADAKTDREAINAAAHSINTFASSIFKSVANGEASNFVCAPFSVSSILSTAAYGARGNTTRQLRSILALPENDTCAHRGSGIIVDQLNAFEGITIESACEVFFATNIRSNQKLESAAKDSINLVVQRVNYSQASKVMNEFFETRTNHRLKDVVKADDIDSKTVAILATAVNFKGRWAEEFDVAETSEREFNSNDGTSKKVPTMFKHDTFNYGELPEVNATFIELPFQKREHRTKSVSMFIVLPDQIDGLAELERNIDKVTLKKLHAGEKCKVRVYLPKFEIESEFDLKESLQSMGLVDMFDENKANFTGLFNHPSLFVKKVLQKTFIEVNEMGSEAAAIKSVQINMLTSTLNEKPQKSCNVDFHVNRPAVFIIATKHVILFSGSLKKPRQN